MANINDSLGDRMKELYSSKPIMHKISKHSSKKTNVYLVDNFELRIRVSFSNIKKVSDTYGFSYDGMASALRNKGIYRKEGYLVTKMVVK